MRIQLFNFVFLLIPLTTWAQEEVLTASGKTVILYPDNTWKFKNEANAADTIALDSVQAQVDSVALPKTPKNFTETVTGFKGFMKPELIIAQLPERSAGTYVFRLKVNKEGIVKEVVTLQRGPNGETELLMRNAITRLKFMWDNSIVPPLTEGTIKLVVPPGR